MRRLLSNGWLLLMLGVITVGLLGLGYAVWSNQLQFETVTVTDDLDVNYDKAFTNDDGTIDDVDKDDGDDGQCPNLGPGSCDPSDRGVIDGPDPRYDKHIATCIAAIDSASTGGKVTKHIFDGYPSYWCTAWFDIDNDGTVPIKLNAVKLNGEEIEPSEDHFVDADQDGDDDFLVHVSELEKCAQVDPGETVQGNVDTHIEQGADEDEAMSYELEFIYMIWNEDTANCPF